MQNKKKNYSLFLGFKFWLIYIYIYIWGVLGKKSIEGIEGDRKAPGVGSGAAGEEAGGADAQVHAGAGASAGACPGPPCAALRRGPGCRRHA